MTEDVSVMEAEKSVICRAYHICFDRTQPDLTLKTESDLKKWQREDILCEVQSHDVSSGMKSIECRVGDEQLWYSETDGSVDRSTLNRELKLEQETPSDGTTITLIAVDLAGNRTKWESRYFLDRTAPVVNFEGVTNGQLLSQPGQLTFQITEEIYEYGTIHFEATRLFEGAASQIECLDCKMTDRETLLQRFYDRDGIYTIVIHASDVAGNVSEAVQVVFRVDVTAPVITLSGPSDGGHFCTEKELLIEIEEEFYQGNQVLLQVTRSLPGSSEAYSIGDWNSDCKKSKLVHTFQKDGIYHIRVEAVDEAGHKAESKQLSFMIDRVAPIVSISGIDANSLVSRAPVITFSSTEQFYDQQIVSTAGFRRGMDQSEERIELPDFESKQEYSKSDYTVVKDGIYHLAIHARDAVGHISEETLSFTYDSTPPQIGYLDTIDKSCQEKFVYRIYVNQNLWDGHQPIEEAGKYIVSVEAVDAVGNLAVKSVEFIIPEEESLTEIQEDSIPAAHQIQERAIPEHDESDDMETSSSVQESIGENQSYAKSKTMNKNFSLPICLFCGIVAVIAAILLAFGYIDRKKGT